MTKPLLSKADVLDLVAPHPRARPFRFDPLAGRTNCSLAEKMIRVFPLSGAASLRISNRQREPQFPKYYGARLRETAPLPPREHRELNREGWARAMRTGCKLRQSIPGEV